LVDGSIYASSVGEHAAWIAVRSGAHVEVVHVIGRRDVSSVPALLPGPLDMNVSAALLEELAELDRQKERLAHERGQLIVDQAQSALLAAGVRGVTPLVHRGDLVEIVQELEAEADVIVIGKRGEGADFAKLHLGSNLERVARASRKPVLAVSRAFRPIRRFLVAYDDGPSARHAIDGLERGTTFQELTAHLLFVGKETSEMREALEGAAERLRRTGHKVETEVVAGEPESIIAQKVVSEEIDLLVMGTYGHSRIRSLFVGSTTTEMIRACKIPVLLFR
jgi:nucleotide-binding universal stress UspA family protein